MTGAVLAQKHTRCPQCRGAIRPGEAIEEHEGKWLHSECCPGELSEVETMRRALRRVGFPVDGLGDRNVEEAARALYELCADFDRSLDHAYAFETKVVCEAPRHTSSRLRRLANFADAVEPIFGEPA